MNLLGGAHFVGNEVLLQKMLLPDSVTAVHHPVYYGLAGQLFFWFRYYGNVFGLTDLFMERDVVSGA